MLLGPPQKDGAPVFLGLIVSNLQLETKAEKFTSITYSIPATVFIRIRQYIETGDYSIIAPLAVEGKEVEELYALSVRKPLDRKPSKVLDLLERETNSNGVSSKL